MTCIWPCRPREVTTNLLTCINPSTRPGVASRQPSHCCHITIIESRRTTGRLANHHLGTASSLPACQACAAAAVCSSSRLLRHHYYGSPPALFMPRISNQKDLTSGIPACNEEWFA